MTRKRFWGLRNALDVRLSEWGKKNMGRCPSGVTTKELRPVSGKPLINFDKAEEFGMKCSSYKEAWDAIADLRRGLGM